MGISRHRRLTTTDRASAVAAAKWILERRAALDPDSEWRFPDVDDLWGVVEFVEREQDGLSAAVLRDDAIAVLAILNHLAGEMARREMYALRIGRRSGATWPMLAGPLGVASYQAAEQRLLRLESLFEGDDGTRDEATGRRLRRRPRRPAVTRPPAVVDDAATAELRAAFGALLALEEQLPEDLADDLLNLRREATPKRAELTAAQFRNVLRMIAGGMRGGEWPEPVAAALARLVAALG